MVVIRVYRESILVKGYRVGEVTRVLYCPSQKDLTDCFWRVTADLQSFGKGFYRYTTKGNPFDQLSVIMNGQFPGSSFSIV